MPVPLAGHLRKIIAPKELCIVDMGYRNSITPAKVTLRHEALSIHLIIRCFRSLQYSAPSSIPAPINEFRLSPTNDAVASFFPTIQVRFHLLNDIFPSYPAILLPSRPHHDDVISYSRPPSAILADSLYPTPALLIADRYQEGAAHPLVSASCNQTTFALHPQTSTIQ